MEAFLSAGDVVAEGDASFGVEVFERFDAAVDDRLVNVDPERLRWLRLGGVGRQEDEADAIGDGERLGMPAGAVEDEEDDPVVPSAGLVGEEGKGVLEEFLVDAGREIPEALAGGRRDEGGDVEPFEAVMAAGDRALAARRPAPAQVAVLRGLVEKVRADRSTRVEEGMISDSDLHREMQTWRHDMHAHPEFGFEEKRTSAFVAAKLREFGLDVAEGVGGTGVVGTLKRGSANRSVGLRADMDALRITEQGTPSYKSTNPGVMHA